MDLQTLEEQCAKVQCPRYDGRKHRLQTLEWIRTRKWPKALKLPDFDDRVNPVTKKWRPFGQRRPGARYDIHAIVTRDVVAMLAGDGRFPIITFEDEAATKTFAEVISAIELASVLNQATTLASIGSVVIVPEIIEPADGRPESKPWLSFTYWRAFEVDPVFRRDRPDVLETVTRTWNVTRAQLAADGYDLTALDAAGATALEQAKTRGRKRKSAGDTPKFNEWYRRAVLDEQRHVNYLPVPKEVYYQADWDNWVEDPDATTVHALGFCPGWFYTTFDDPDSRPDGACLFEAAVDNAILIDKVLSVAANAVVAAGTPQMAIVRKNSAPAIGELTGSASSPTSGEISPDDILQVDEKGGAWLVQLEGGLTPLDVVLARLRTITLENVGGSRMSEQTAAGAKSGYAMELLNQALTYVAGLMRPSFQRAAVGIVRMLANMVDKFGDVDCDGGTLKKGEIVALGTAIIKAVSYGPNYELSGQDKAQEVLAVVKAVAAGLMSMETAVAQVAQLFDITDIEAERKRVTAEQQQSQNEEAENSATAHQRALELKTAGAAPGGAQT